jgi:hypothetical protein
MATTGKAILAMAFGYGAGVWFTVSAVRRTMLLNRANQWFSARGRILESTIYREPGSGKEHFRIRYEFEVGERIEGTTPRLCGDWFWGSKDQNAFVARYVAGQEVEVFYDPRDPRRNCLDRTDRTGVTAMWCLAGGGVALASFLLWMLFQEAGIAAR